MNRIFVNKRAENRVKNRWVIPVFDDSIAASRVMARHATKTAAFPKEAQGAAIIMVRACAASSQRSWSLR
jgi:hypothetical protein